MSDVEKSKLKEACELCAANYGKEDDIEFQNQLYDYIKVKFSDNNKTWSYSTINHVIEKWLKVK